MSQHRASTSRNGFWHDSQPDRQAFSPSIGVSNCEPWLQSLHHAPMTTNLPYEHTAGNYLESDGMGLIPDATNVLPGPYHANTMINQELNNVYHLQGGLFNPTLPYGVPKSSLNSNGDFQQIAHWNHEVDTGVETSAVNLEPTAQYGIMSTVPGPAAFNHVDAAITDFGPYSGGFDQRLPVSPSQSSSAAGSSSTSATMDLSSRGSSVYPSHSVVSNSSERAQADTYPFLMSAAAAAAGTATTTTAASGTATTTTAASGTVTIATTAAKSPRERKGKAAPAQEVEATMGPKRSQSLNTGQERDRKTPTISAGTPSATEYTTPSADPIPGMVYAADGPFFSTSPSHSELSNHSQVPVPIPVPQVPRSSQRQRNRRAATKCREKTKAAMIQLEATEKAESQKHMELSKTFADLRGEVLALKNQLLLHGNCECDVIQKYLKNAARSIGEGPRPSVSYTSSPGRETAWTAPQQYSRHNSYS